MAQKINPFDGGNGWDSFTNPVTGVVGPVTGSLYVLDQPLRYSKQDSTESDFKFVSGSASLPGQSGLNGLFKPVRNNRIGTGCPRGEIEYYLEGKNPVGIGFEKIIDNREVPLDMVNRVAPGKNVTIHAPN